MTARQAALATVLDAAARGDGQAAGAATILLLRHDMPQTAVTQIVEAAINLDSRDFVAAAARVAVAAELPPPVRANLAWRLALTGFAAEGMAVLLAEPRMLTDPQFRLRSTVILRELRNRGTPGSLLTEQAGALLRRLLPSEEAPFVQSPHLFAGDRAAKPRLEGAPVALHAAPELPAVILDDAAAAIAKFERMALAAPFPEVSLLTDVFVNRTGQIWNREGQVFRAYNRPIPPASHAAEATAREIPQAVLAIEPHNNVFHWFAQWFPSLAWRLDDGASAMPVLIRDDAARFLGESLALGAAAPLPIETAGDAVLVRELHLADARLVLLARQGLTGPLYGRVRERATAGAARAARPLYISRRDTPRRPLGNEAELEAALAERGFDIVTMSSLSFAEQIARVDGADMVVGAHGAGFALLAAARPGRAVVEIVPSVRGDMQIRVSMANISRMVGHRHHLWLELMPAATAGRWSVALEPFLALVDRVRAGGA